ncbi:hypothetical protein QZH41_004927 [Actinostola sp. cb2023]|nr:hypothetical protein QZH41_004927 [Actinostola sp. cb2023]
MSATDERQDQFSEDSLSPTVADLVAFKRAETFSGFDNKQKLGNVEQSVTRAWSMKTERTPKTYNRQVPDAAVSTPELESPVAKHKRRGSGGWSFRNKNKDERDEVNTSSPVNTPEQEQMVRTYYKDYIIENAYKKYNQVNVN